MLYIVLNYNLVHLYEEIHVIQCVSGNTFQIISLSTSCFLQWVSSGKLKGTVLKYFIFYIEVHDQHVVSGWRRSEERGQEWRFRI